MKCGDDQRWSKKEIRVRIGTFVLLAVAPHDEVCMVRCTCGTTTL